MPRSPSCESNFDVPQHEANKAAHEQLNFIQKAYDLVNNPKNSEIIHWSRSGFTFIIEDIERFEKELLPLYFRHNRYQSFVRQLNMYDFHKIRNGDYYCDNKSEFRHDEFRKGNYQAISVIRRKGFQLKHKEKQNTKIKKGQKINTRKAMKKRRPALKPLPKPELQARMESEENSFFLELHKESGQVQVNNKADIKSKITRSSIEHFEKDGFDLFNKRSRLNQIIDLAEQVKEEWLESSQKISGPEDIQDMKEIYYIAKDDLQARADPRETQKLTDDHLLQIGEQEDAIIESIFKAEIRSTLICITSETFLHNHGQPKYDTLIGM